MPRIPDDWGPARKAQAIDARREAQWLKRKGMEVNDIYATLMERGYPAAAARWAIGEEE